MPEHMRIGLLDPRWLEQRDRSIRDRQTEDEVYAPGLDIESSLKQLAERRTDIFGVEETAIGKKIGEEEIQKPEEKVKTLSNCSFYKTVFNNNNNNNNCILLHFRLPGMGTLEAWLVHSRQRRPTSPCKSR